MSDYNFNYDGSKFRLQIDNIRYFTNEKTLDRWISRFNDFIDSLGIMYRDFTSRAANASEHDLRYIQDISTTAVEKSGLQ